MSPSEPVAPMTVNMLPVDTRIVKSMENPEIWQLTWESRYPLKYRSLTATNTNGDEVTYCPELLGYFAIHYWNNNLKNNISGSKHLGWADAIRAYLVFRRRIRIAEQQERQALKLQEHTSRRRVNDQISAFFNNIGV